MSGLVNQKTKLYRKDCMKSILKQVYIIGCMAEKHDSETLLESADIYKFIKLLTVTCDYSIL